MKQHDSADDLPVPLADLSVALPPEPLPSQPLPEVARTDELTTPLIQGATARSVFRRQLIKDKIQKACLAGPDPVMHVEHPPHMLEQVESSVVPDEIVEDGLVEEPQSRSLGRKRKWELVIELPRRRRPTVQAPREVIVESEVEQVDGAAVAESEKVEDNPGEAGGGNSGSQQEHETEDIEMTSPDVETENTLTVPTDDATAMQGSEAPIINNTDPVEGVSSPSPNPFSQRDPTVVDLPAETALPAAISSPPAQPDHTDSATDAVEMETAPNDTGAGPEASQASLSEDIVMTDNPSEPDQEGKREVPELAQGVEDDLEVEQELLADDAGSSPKGRDGLADANSTVMEVVPEIPTDDTGLDERAGQQHDGASEGTVQATAEASVVGGDTETTPGTPLLEKSTADASDVQGIVGEVDMASSSMDDAALSSGQDGSEGVNQVTRSATTEDGITVVVAETKEGQDTSTSVLVSTVRHASPEPAPITTIVNGIGMDTTAENIVGTE
jgi:hypothetical protein